MPTICLIFCRYAFCRVTDDLVDSPDAASDPHDTISMISDFLTLLFGPPLPPSSPSPMSSSPLLPDAHPTRPAGLYPLPAPPPLTPSELDQFLNDRVRPSSHFAFRLLANLRGLIPRYPLDELLRGYTTDNAFPLSPSSIQTHSAPIKTTENLLDYGLCVAGSVAELLVYLSWASSPGEIPLSQKEREHVLLASREMGVALQLVNIARDLRGDALEGRCYLPLAFFRLAPDSKLSIPTETSKQQGQADWTSLLLPDEKRGLKWERYSLPLLTYANTLAAHAAGGIDRLPVEVKAGMRAACASYLLIGQEIEHVWKGDVGERRTVAGWKRVKRVVQVVVGGWEGK